MTWGQLLRNINCIFYLAKVHFMQFPVLSQSYNSNIAVIALLEQGTVDVLDSRQKLFPEI
jgi:hypothetical protein